MAVLRRTLAVGAILVIAAVAGCGSKRAHVVGPSKYMASVCGAIGPWVRDIDERSAAFSPTAVSGPAQRKQAAQQFLAAVVGDTNHALRQLKAAGIPRVQGGKGIAAALISVFGQLKAVFVRASAQASNLPTQTTSAYNQAAQQLRNSIRSSTTSARAGLGVLRNPQLQQAAANEPSCQGAAA